MADTIHVERWCPPWQPSRDAELIETLNYYDMPLVGIVRQHGVDYLFSCITGHTEPIHSWAYVLLTAGDRERIREASPEQLRDIVQELLSTGPMVLAIASDESGTYGGLEIDSLDDFDSAVHDLVDEFRRYVEEEARRAEEIQLQHPA